MLISFAHPDDESFGMGGAIAYYAERGVDITLICSTNGDVGTVPPEFMAGYDTISALRLDELEGYNGEGGDNYLERVLVDVTLLSDGTRVSAWTYFYTGDVEDREQIEEGDWREYFLYRGFDAKGTLRKPL